MGVAIYGPASTATPSALPRPAPLCGTGGRAAQAPVRSGAYAGPCETPLPACMVRACRSSPGTPDNHPRCSWQPPPRAHRAAHAWPPAAAPALRHPRRRQQVLQLPDCQLRPCRLAELRHQAPAQQCAGGKTHASSHQVHFKRPRPQRQLALGAGTGGGGKYCNLASTRVFMRA